MSVLPLLKKKSIVDAYTTCPIGLLVPNTPFPLINNKWIPPGVPFNATPSSSSSFRSGSSSTSLMPLHSTNSKKKKKTAPRKEEETKDDPNNVTAKSTDPNNKDPSIDTTKKGK